MSKSSTREKIRSVLIELSEDGLFEKKNRLLASSLENFFKNHLSHFAKSNQNLVGAYAPTKYEANWRAFLSREFESKIRWAFPRSLGDGTMEFCESRYEDLEESSDFGVKLLAPKKDKKKCFPELLLIPGLAFGLTGERLGKGKGYYDKYLETFKGIKVGLCFEEQILDSLPTEIHDQKMNYVITDKRILKCEGAK